MSVAPVAVAAVPVAAVPVAAASASSAVCAGAVEPDACESLIEAFRQVADPRHARGIRHPLPSVLALCVTGLLAGRQNLTQIHRYGKDYPEVLLALGFRKRRSPVPTTRCPVCWAVCA